MERSLDRAKQFRFSGLGFSEPTPVAPARARASLYLKVGVEDEGSDNCTCC